MNETGACQFGGPAAAADRLVGFINGDPQARGRKNDRTREPIGTCADDDGVGG